MRYFPLFLDMRARQVLFSGSGEAATAKLRLLLKTEADIQVYDEGEAAEAAPEILNWAAAGRLRYFARPVSPADLSGADILYIAHDNADAVSAELGADPSSASPDKTLKKHDHSATSLREIARKAGVLVNVVDTPEECDFITPALVDRDPVVIAIGTEGSAPVLARQIKAKLESWLPSSTGALARLAAKLRPKALALPAGAPRRRLWSRFFEDNGPRAYQQGGEEAAETAFDELLARERAGAAASQSHVALVGAGPGDPELLTIKAQKRIAEADVIIHDRLVSSEVLELARREARLIAVGKTPGAKGWSQEAINALIIEEARGNQRVVRLKSGDPGVYGRLDEEIEALDAAGIAFEVVPGITAAMAGAAELGLSLTRRGRNSSFGLFTGHDIDGFAEHNWQALAKPGASAAIYMGVRAARFIEGRMLMHGASPSLPVTVVENISRDTRREISCQLDGLSQAMQAGGIKGPAILYLGIARRAEAAISPALPEGISSAQPARIPANAKERHHAQIG